ncbi:hypothetical protein J2X90_004549 [Variovorax paradoxus]|uniref:hypothetical protein n=1 Tax=Variovorax paradoxus TaxID=34073 RepID=UPI002788B65B|nr:hypothetical protein [Variovorax paradoxus]MDQ0026722.1 hypothetical protein [Variovorax paradoxus]
MNLAIQFVLSNAATEQALSGTMIVVKWDACANFSLWPTVANVATEATESP